LLLLPRVGRIFPAWVFLLLLRTLRVLRALLLLTRLAGLAGLLLTSGLLAGLLLLVLLRVLWILRILGIIRHDGSFLLTKLTVVRNLTGTPIKRPADQRRSPSQTWLGATNDRFRRSLSGEAEHLREG
jgi:hypothetical protein